MPSRCSTSARSRCSGSSCGLLCWRATSIAAATASRAFSVYLLMFIAVRLSLCRRVFRGLFQLLELLEMLALFGRELARQLDVDGGVEVAVLVRPAGDRHAVALQPEGLADLRRLRNPEAQRLAGERRHFRLAAEHRRRQGDLHLGVEIAALALEPIVRRQTDAEIQVAGLSTVGALFTFAGHPYPRSLADSGRNPDVDRTSVAVVLDREPHHLAAVGVLERQLDLLLDIAPLARTALAAPTRPAPSGVVLAAHRAAEERLEEIGERVRVSEHLAHFVFGHRAEAALAAARPSCAPVELARVESLESGAAGGAGLLVGAPVRAELVVFLPFLGIAEHLVGFVDFLELRLGRL